jgi:hypothetical protein
MARKPKMIETSAVLQQAPETAGVATETETVEITKAKRANHELLNAAGEVVENEEEATGIRYTLLANNQSFDYQTGLEAGKGSTMLAIFGAKTLATNETSAARNNSKGAASADEQMDAVRERFAIIAEGKWVDRTREGVGAKVDLDALAEAICRVLIAEGKSTQADVDGGYKAKVRAKLDDDKTYARKARSYAPVAAAYAELVGKTSATVDDLLA